MTTTTTTATTATSNDNYPNDNYPITITEMDEEAIQEDIQSLKAYSPVEFRFVVARSYSKSTSQALATCGLSQGWLELDDRKNRLLPLADKLATNRILQAEFRLREIVPAAIDSMVNLMENSADDRVRFQATKDILDRAGVKASDKIQLEVTGNVSLRSLQDVLMQVYGGAGAGSVGDDNDTDK